MFLICNFGVLVNRFLRPLHALQEASGEVKKCTDETQAAEQEHCFELTDAIPSMRDLETYSMDKEAVARLF